jgi:hypothetical protein
MQGQRSPPAQGSRSASWRQPQRSSHGYDSGGLVPFVSATHFRAEADHRNRGLIWKRLCRFASPRRPQPGSQSGTPDGDAPGCPTVAPHASLRGATPRIRRAEGQSPAPVMVNAGTLGWVPLGALRVGSARHIRTVCREPVCRRAARIEESRNRPGCFRYPWRTGCWPLPCSRAGACGTRTGRGADDEALR